MEAVDGAAGRCRNRGRRRPRRFTFSRSAARQRFTWQDVTPLLRANHVKLFSAGIDENPFVCIHRVMAQQRDLVDVGARFEPRVVRMDSK